MIEAPTIITIAVVLFFGLFAVLALLNCDEPAQTSNPEAIAADDPTDGFTSDECQTAALQIIGLQHTGTKSYLGGTVAEAEHAIDHIDQLRVKYTDYAPARMRRHIFKWLDYFERQARENLRDCETQASRKDLDAYRAKSAAENARVQELQARLQARLREWRQP